MSGSSPASRAKTRCRNFSTPSISRRRPNGGSPSLRDEPALTGDARLDALAGRRRGVSGAAISTAIVPAWAFEPVRYLDRPWHTTPFDRRRDARISHLREPGRVPLAQHLHRRTAAAPRAQRSACAAHDHRHRRAGRLRQGHARQAARRPLRAAAPRYRPDLPGGGEGGARCRPFARRSGARAWPPPRRSIPPVSTRPRSRARRSARRPRVVSAIPEVRARAARVPARVRPHAARRGARRPRHRHGHLSRRRREDLRHRNAGGARAPPRRRAAGGRRRRSTKPRCSPTSCAATSATPPGRRRR